MKKILIIAGLLFFGANLSYSQRKIQVAILFDTSNSMDGLVDQAKSRIWKIVNEIGSLRYNNEMPTMEFALYRYGNDNLSATDNYIEQLLGLTSDLDVISQKLFSLTTNGGEEYCGAVIGKSLQDLNWSVSPLDLKMIYIAGNEPFDQGTVDFKVECKKAADRGIFINTIHCGSYDKGVVDKWKEGADCSGGDYFNIDSNKEVVRIDTPYDADIQVYNDSLNQTYYGYGAQGAQRKEMQTFEDGNAMNEAPSVATDRAVAKSKSNVYFNNSWDLLDGAKNGDIKLEEMAEEELPEEFKGKTNEEKNLLLNQKQKERESHQAKIAQLATDREAFIAKEMEKRAAEGEEIDDFGSSVNKSILEKANNIGYQKETPTE